MNPTTSECATCGAELRGGWCHECGEQARAADDLRVGTFVKRAAAGVLDLDSRLWRTYRELVRRPGLLTNEFVLGRRQPYLHPLQTFLLANLVFFALLTSIGGFNTFTTQLRYHVQQPVYGGVAERLVERQGEPGSADRAEFVERFDEATPRYANSMLLLMAAVFGLLFALLYLRRRHMFVGHIVFALHFMTFLLLLITVLPFPLRLLALVAPDLAASLGNSELPILICISTGCLLYLVPAIHRVYGDGPVAATARALAATFLLWPALVVYRGILFFVVYWSVG